MSDEARQPKEAGDDGLAGFSAAERRVIATFVRDGVIPTFPAKQSRQLVLWRYVVRMFEHGRDYPEPELNALLRPLNPDVATIRRALVDFRLMRREAGVYRRVDDDVLLGK